MLFITNTTLYTQILFYVTRQQEKQNYANLTRYGLV